MQEHTLIANSGIQIITFPLRINTQEKFKMWYHEWYDTENGEWRLDPVYELRTDDECYYYNKQKLHKGGYLSDPTIEIDVNELKSDDILPLRIEDENCPGVRGDIFSLTFSDKDNKFSHIKTAPSFGKIHYICNMKEIIETMPRIELALIIIGVFVLILGIILGYAMIHEYRMYLENHWKARYSFRDFIKRERFYIYLLLASIFIFLTNLLYFLE